MPPPVFGRFDFQQALQRLMPRGRIWRADQLAILTQTLGSLSPTYERSTQSAAQLLIDANPTTTQNLLFEWEESLGLPDFCTVPSPSLAQRQAAVRAKWGARGSLTIAYFVALAAGLGFPITITEFAPFAAGMACGQGCNGPASVYTWHIDAPTGTQTLFSAGHSAAGDPLAFSNGAEMVCRITRDKPAGTIVWFTFGGSGLLYNDGGVLALGYGSAWPVTAGGAGTFFSNGGVASVVPGATFVPDSPLIAFGIATSTALLAINDGGKLQWTPPTPGSGVLWVPGGAAGGDIWVG